MPRATSFKVSLNLPFGLGGVEQSWEPERRGAPRRLGALRRAHDTSRDRPTRTRDRPATRSTHLALHPLRDHPRDPPPLRTRSRPTQTPRRRLIRNTRRHNPQPSTPPPPQQMAPTPPRPRRPTTSRNHTRRLGAAMGTLRRAQRRTRRGTPHHRPVQHPPRRGRRSPRIQQHQPQLAHHTTKPPSPPARRVGQLDRRAATATGTKGTDRRQPQLSETRYQTLTNAATTGVDQRPEAV